MGPGAGLEVEARGVLVIPLGNRGLLQWTSLWGSGSGSARSPVAQDQTDMFWVGVTS